MNELTMSKEAIPYIEIAEQINTMRRVYPLSFFLF